MSGPLGIGGGSGGGGGGGGGAALSTANIWTAIQTFSGGMSVINPLVSTAITPVALDAQATHDGANGLSASMVTWSHTVGQGTGRILIVSVVSVVSASRVQWYGLELFRVYEVQGTFANQQFWALIDPPSTTGTVTVTFPSATSSASASASFLNVDFSYPFVNAFNTGAGTADSSTTFSVGGHVTAASVSGYVYLVGYGQAYRNTNSDGISTNGVITGTATPITLTKFAERTPDSDLRAAWFTSPSSSPGITSDWTAQKTTAAGANIALRISSIALRPRGLIDYGSVTVQPRNVTDVIIPDDFGQLFDGNTTVFQLKKNQVVLNGIVNSHDVTVIIGGYTLAPYVRQRAYPWIVEFDSFRGFRIRDGKLIVYVAPQAGDEVSTIIQGNSVTIPEKMYPYSPTSIAFGD